MPDAVVNPASRSANETLARLGIEEQQHGADQQHDGQQRYADPFGDPQRHQNACPIEM